MRPSDTQLVHTDALLTAVGARQASAVVLTADPFAAALLDFAYDVDLTAGIADLDATPIPVELLRLTPGPVAPRRFTWRIAIPAMSTAVAAIVVGIAVLLGRGTPVIVSPSATAAAESRQLLTHAHSLIADAGKASTRAERQRLVSEARADLSHVSRLLPLTSTGDRPAIRQQLRSLERQVIVVPAQGAASSNETNNRSSGSGPGPDGSGQQSNGGQGPSRRGTVGQSGTVEDTPPATAPTTAPTPSPSESPSGGVDGGTGTQTGPGGTGPSAPPTPTHPPQGGGPGSGGGGHQGPPQGGGGHQGPPSLSS